MAFHKMEQDKLSLARTEMEELLESLEKISDNGSGWCLFPKNHSKLIGRGDLALVLELSGGLVGKILFYEEVKECPDCYCSIGLYVGEMPHNIERTVIALREMGFDNVLDHIEISRYPHARPSNALVGPAIVTESGEGIIYPCFYHLSPDLREKGKYDVYSIEDFPFEAVENRQELKTEIGDSLARIKSELESGKYALEVDHHGTRDEPDEALRKMFIGRVDKQNNRGELFFADLDHCVIYRKTGSS